MPGLFEDRCGFRYTKPTRDHYRGFKKHRGLLKHLHNLSPIIKEREVELSKNTYKTVCKQKFKEYLKVRSTVANDLYGFYADKETLGYNGKNKVPLFRKLRFSKHIRKQQTDEYVVKLVKSIAKSEPVTVAYGNWSASNCKHQTPQQGVGMLRTLEKKGSNVFLIDEYNTSKLCPTCENPLEMFKKCPNPRPYMRDVNPEVDCWGIRK